MFNKSKIRVAILIGQLGFGGAERQLYYFLKHSDRGLFNYHVLVLNSRKPHTYDDAIRELGIDIRQLPETCTGISQRSRMLYREIKDMRPDIVHSWSFYANPYAALVGVLARVPVCLGSMRNEPLAATISRLHPIHRWLAYRSVLGIVTNTKLAADQMLEIGLAKKSVFLVYNGIEISEAQDIRSTSQIDLSKYGIRSDSQVIGTVGNLQRCKNQEMFIKAMDRISLQLPDVHGLIVGRPLANEPGVQDKLEQQISELGMSDRVHLAGFREDVPDLMQRFTVFCLTSRSEGMPNVVMEAMAASCPVVSTRVGDVPEVINDGENGLLVESEDADGLANAIQLLLNDADLAKRMEVEGRHTIEQRFSCQEMAQNMENVYIRMLKAQGIKGD